MIFINKGTNTIQTYFSLYVSNIIGEHLIIVIKVYLPLFHNSNP